MRMYSAREAGEMAGKIAGMFEAMSLGGTSVTIEHDMSNGYIVCVYHNKELVQTFGGDEI